MNTNSNSYTIIYAAVMVVIVAFLLAFVNSALSEKQAKNIELDTKKQILSALGIKDVADADAEYAKIVKSDMLVQADGTLLPYEGKFITNYEKDSKENNNNHLFVCEVNGATKYVIPVYGVGLWGAIWGYVALNEDKNSVYGTYFSHASETPGLGAEIAGEPFQNAFKEKKVLEGENIGLGVAQSGKVDNAEFQVDGLSGSTITCKAVDKMLKGCMGNYTKFLISK